MKAKEYAEKYNTAKDKTECLTEILTSFYKELMFLIKTRNAKRNSAIFAILDELNQKWFAFVNRVEDRLDLYGFKYLVKKIVPDVFDAWIKDSERRINLRHGENVYERWDRMHLSSLKERTK